MSVEVLPGFLGSTTDEAMDPLKSLIAVKHRGPLNRVQLSRRPDAAPRVREIRDELITCDLCQGAGCRPCEGSGKIQRYPHAMEQFVVAPDDWSDGQVRDRILRQIWADGTGYPDEFYAAKDTFREDAGYCYQTHNRPGSEKGPHACIDYQSDSKRLTDSQWRLRGEMQGMSREDVFLCTFCPYSSVVTTRKRSARGDYDS